VAGRGFWILDSQPWIHLRHRVLRPEVDGNFGLEVRNRRILMGFVVDGWFPRTFFLRQAHQVIENIGGRPKIGQNNPKFGNLSCK